MEMNQSARQRQRLKKEAEKAKSTQPKLSDDGAFYTEKRGSAV